MEVAGSCDGSLGDALVPSVQRDALQAQPNVVLEVADVAVRDQLPRPGVDVEVAVGEPSLACSFVALVKSKTLPPLNPHCRHHRRPPPCRCNPRDAPATLVGAPPPGPCRGQSPGVTYAANPPRPSGKFALPLLAHSWSMEATLLSRNRRCLYLRYWCP
jgi:hypothetical protein